jgi:hypothetical protein
MSYCLNTFEFIDKDEQIMYETAFNAITQLELWEYVKNSNESLFTHSIEIQQIYDKIEELGYYGHSGNSFIFIMYRMRKIAEIGLDDFKQFYLKNK